MAGVLAPLRAYSFRHPHFPSLHEKASALASQLRERSPTPGPRRTAIQALASADGFTVPTILGAATLDW